MQLSTAPIKCPNCGHDIAAVNFHLGDGQNIKFPFVIPAGKPVQVAVADGTCAPQTIFLYPPQDKS